MVINSDIILRGSVWREAAERYASIFRERTNYDVFLLSTSIGVVYDKRKETVDDGSGQEISIPRTVFNGRTDPFEKLLQTAILSSGTVNLSDEDRMKIAFSEKEGDFNRVQLLVEYANYGVEKLNSLVGVDDVETMENLKNLIVGTVEGSNFEITSLSDDVVAEAFAEYEV